METFINNHVIAISRIACNHINDPSHPNYINYVLTVDGHQRAVADSPAGMWVEHDRLLKECAA